MAPPRRFRAPPTAHLSSRLRRGIAKNVPKLPAPTPETNSNFRESFDYYWLTFLNTESPSKDAKEQVIFNFDEIVGKVDNDSAQPEDDIERLCHILDQISGQFQDKGRLYVAMAAKAAISLVRSGRQDDINPGLWRYIRQFEEANVNNTSKH